MYEGELYEYLNRYYSEKGIFEPQYLTNARYIVVECKECSLIYQKDIPNEFLLERIYGVWLDPVAAAERNKNHLGSNVKQYIQEQLIISKLTKGKKLRILDYGMGHGRWCELALNFGHDVYGYEFENERVKNLIAKNKIKPIDYNEILEHKFDFINSEQVFEHLVQPLEVLIHLKQSLTKKGIIRLGVPSGVNLKEIINLNKSLNFVKGSKNNLTPIVPLQHLNCFTPETLIKLGTKAGLNHFLLPLKIIIGSKLDWELPQKAIFNFFHPVYNRFRYKDGMAQYFTL